MPKHAAPSPALLGLYMALLCPNAAIFARYLIWISEQVFL
jgi:hypothetical protein